MSGSPPGDCADLARPIHETAGQKKPSQTRRRVSWLSALGALVAVGAIAGLAAWLIEFEDAAGGLEELVRSWGPYAALASISLMVLHSFVPFPAEMLAIANGMLFGPLWGTVVTWTGAMLGAYLAFGLARYLGRPFVESLVPERHWATLDAWSDRRGGIALFLSRLVPVISFNLINYAAGLTSISWWTFTWATALGILPITLVSVFIGAGILRFSGG